jgi:hypothetical protein
MEHDHLFKELLATFFIEFLDLFLPEVSAYVERDRLEFLDKEVFTDVAAAERHEVDLLVKARFRGRDAFFLIHVENQASPQEQFAARMFRYFARLHEKHALPVYPIALFSYDAPLRPEPDLYEVIFPNRRVLEFSFDVIQLNRLNWRDYLRTPNPVASALMTKMRIAPEDRPSVKLECLRMLATLKLDRARATLIGTFMNSYLRLTAAENAVYNREVEAIAPPEREVVMKLTNEWIEQGEAQGERAALRRAAARQLHRLFGPPSTALTARIDTLSTPQLDQLIEDLVDFETLADAEAWLARQS